MIEHGIRLFFDAAFASVVQKNSGDKTVSFVRRELFTKAFQTEEILRDVDRRLSVPDKSAVAKCVSGMVLAGRGSGDFVEVGGECGQRFFCKGANGDIPDCGQFSLENLRCVVHDDSFRNVLVSAVGLEPTRFRTAF